MYPVRPIAVVWAFVASDLDVSSNGDVGVVEQPARSSPKVIALPSASPVAFDAPATVLFWMTEPCPAVEFAVELLVHSCEYLLGHAGAIVLCPSSDFGIERLD